MKVCSTCGREKQGESFPADKARHGGLRGVCKECCSIRDAEYYSRNRDEILRKRQRLGTRFKRVLSYSRTIAKQRGYVPCDATVDEIKLAFDGQCAICGILESECSRRLSLDHSHESGCFRGWLCYKCNTSIAGLGDSADLVFVAFEYLSHQT